ncbi:MAG: fructose-6-phosphate aldolase [Candidatus Izemoplasmatales bacterium]|jgi:transaldolase|nr:fructose-6-phosphate aldolase [Candidatus Izemoplasmatales bacterium]MDD4355170.1 fructose-6-phosphate aldolase [Candidatus Izemoplasmatales bacterium]MDD4988080.1 fructose-6-phosphate aldolase [Candidatus Izemoplasmatales bacterium]MDD5601578.1 fructose-6-phosphate aldolase [Candidatus Izemoplasmatales bacterium]NLF48681.1 fructose-6-phosphate aldolase [Acholeplasmataceae bacterium]
MIFFIDTANIEEIREASTWGIISGVTTNPSLIAKENRPLLDAIKEITELINGPISAEVQEGNADEMVEEAFQYARMHPNIVIKVPMTFEGIKATKRLTSYQIRTNVTLIFTVSQAIMAAKAGATYVSPFLGRLDDYCESKEAGAELVKDIRTAFDNYHYPSKIIAASIRHPEHVRQAALFGADVATIPYKVLRQMIEHPLTTKGLALFRQAAQK